MTIGKVLHIGSMQPKDSNRLALQLSYAAPTVRTDVIDLSVRASGSSGQPLHGEQYRSVPNRPRLSVSDPYLIRRAKSLLRRILNTITLTGWLWRSDADVMHAHENSALWAIAFWTIVLRRPAVWDPHDFIHDRVSKRSRFGNVNRLAILERLVARKGVPILVVSDGMMAEYASMYPDNAIRIIRNYSADRIGAHGPVARDVVESRSSKPEGQLRIVYPGLIKPQRMEPALLDAIGKLPGVAFDIYGTDRSSGYQAELEALIAERGYDNIRFMGRYESHNVRTILADYHFAIFPFPVTYKNLRFCLPNKFFQCLEASLPMIMTDMEEMGALVRQFGLGHVFPSRDYASCSEILANLEPTAPGYLQLIENVSRYRSDEIRYEEQRAELLRAYTLAAERGGHKDG